MELNIGSERDLLLIWNTLVIEIKSENKPGLTTLAFGEREHN